jgi:hypothetical protein
MGEHVMSQDPSPYVYVVQLAIPEEIERRFNELYDNEHVPAFMSVPGVKACSRYKLEWADTDQMPEYLAIYDVDAPDVPKSEAWRQGSAHGDWVVEIRPHMRIRRHGMFKRLSTVRPHDATRGPKAKE